MAHNRKSDNGTLPKTACAVVFILFVFIYLYFFQSDMLFMVQHVLSGGTTRYDRTAGAVIITLALYLIQVGVGKLGGFSSSFHALTYFPSLVLLAVLTGVDSRFTGSMPYHTWVWFAPLLLVVYVLAVFLLRSAGKSDAPQPSEQDPVASLWKNLLLMSVMFLAVCFSANTDLTFHNRLRMERLISNGSYTKALQVGENSGHTDASLTMLRAYALSRSRQLGERLFEYQPVGGSSSLLPDGKDVRCLFYPESKIIKALSIRKKGTMPAMDYLTYISRNGLAMKPATDYILCGYLLDKNLDAFVHAIMGKYNIASPSLPKHYKEALTLYTHLRANPVITYHSEVMDADYADFRSITRTYTDKRERMTRARDAYGNTYWFYYFYTDL